MTCFYIFAFYKEGMFTKTLDIKKKGKVNSKKYSIISYGCQMNVSDSERLSSGLKSLGLENSENENSGESIKLTIRFLTNEIRSDAIDLKIYYKKCNTSNNCKVTERNTTLVNELKKQILKKKQIGNQS